jgi:hypothetical protein
MKLYQLLCTLVVLLVICGCGNAATLVENHQPKAIIVVPAGTNPQVGPVDSVDTDINLKHAPTSPEAVKQGLNNAFQWYTATTNSVAVGAMELQDYVKKATGAKLEIKNENQLTKSDSSLNKIFVGPCKETIAFIDISKIQPEGFVIKTRGKDIFIVGSDKTKTGFADGTLNGCYGFLKRYVGVRWIMPTEIGEVVPKAASLNVENVDVKDEPKLWERRIRDCHAHLEYGRVASYLKEWGLSMDQWEKFFDHNITNAWFRSHGLGARAEIRAMHSNMGYWDKYHEKYPEIFAMQSDGTRINTNVREMLCISNPKTWEIVVQEKIDEFKKNPMRTCASITPSDDGDNRFCMCDKCAAWDPPGSPKIYDEKGKLTISLTDRYFRYFNEVSKLVAKQMPDKYLGVYVYLPYKELPVTFNKLEKNLFVGYNGFETYLNDKELEYNRDLWLGWSKMADKMYLRPNLFWFGMGLPINYTHKFADDIRFMADNGMLAADFDGCIGNWGGEGIDYYVAAELLWSPYADVNAVIDDYCKAAYGKGSDEMKAYYDRLEALTSKIAADCKYKDRYNAYILMGYYTDDVLKELQSHVDKALAAIGDSDKGATERVKLVTTTLDYTRQLKRLIMAAYAVRTGQSNEEEFKKVKAEVIKYFTSMVTNWSVATAHNYTYIRETLSLEPIRIN